MRKSVAFLLPVVVCLCALYPAAEALAEPAVTGSEALPLRRPGLWRVSTISAAAGLHVGETCVGPHDSIIGPLESDCAQPRITRAADQIVVTILCGVGRRRITTSLLFTGDFAAWYRAQGKITEGEVAGVDADLHTGFTIDAKFMQSDCKDAIHPN
jgi:hypothetical protein